MVRDHCCNEKWKADRMMLDSGTTSHLTPLANRVQSKTVCNIPISLADDPTVHSSHKGIRKVTIATDGSPRKASLSDTVVVLNAGMSLLPVPSLVRKDIGVLFMPKKAVLFDLLDDMSILVYAEQDQEGLFYISDDSQTMGSPIPRAHQEKVSALVAIVRQRFLENKPTRLNHVTTASIVSPFEDNIEDESYAEKTAKSTKRFDDN